MTTTTTADGEVPAVVCDHVRKSFGATVALRDLSIEVRRGSITALLGPSGCGKTTALRIVAGLEDLDAGEVSIHGRTVASPARSVPAEQRQVGMVFQDYALFPHLSVGDNVAFGLADRSGRERHRRAREVLELVGLTGLESRLPSELSGGQQQRVALARALAPDPQLVLLDEPFSNLDAGLRASVREDVRRILGEAGATAVFVTHDQEEALSLADEVAVMADGWVRQVADPFTLYTRPADPFVAAFVGDADLVPGQRAGRYFVQTPVGRVPTANPVEAEEVDVVLRPEALRVRGDASGDALVEGVTYFGHDQLIHLRLDDGTTVRSRYGPEMAVRPGDRVELKVLGTVVAFPHDPSARVHVPDEVSTGRPATSEPEAPTTAR